MKRSECTPGSHRWGLIPAGGDGTRLLPLTRNSRRQVWSSSLPNAARLQPFCNSSCSTFWIRSMPSPSTLVREISIGKQTRPLREKVPRARHATLYTKTREPTSSNSWRGPGRVDCRQSPAKKLHSRSCLRSGKKYRRPGIHLPGGRLHL